MSGPRLFVDLSYPTCVTHLCLDSAVFILAKLFSFYPCFCFVDGSLQIIMGSLRKSMINDDYHKSIDVQ